MDLYLIIKLKVNKLKKFLSLFLKLIPIDSRIQMIVPSLSALFTGPKNIPSTLAVE
jgi:hypothetical protein